jgi:AcrR family transcriptional regulator
LRTDLIGAADAILARTGDVEGLSLRAVAREVGIATPSIYLHFPDKSALVRAVLDARFGELAEAVRTAVGQQTNPIARLRAGCLTYCRFATEHPNAYRVLFSRRSAAGAGEVGGGRSESEPDQIGTEGRGRLGVGPDQIDARKPAPTTGSHVGAGFQHPTPASFNPNLPRSSAPIPSDSNPNLPPSRPSRSQERRTGGGGSPGADAFNLLVDGVAACMRAGVAPDDDPFRVATNVWTALHGIVSLRSAVPGFSWPELERQVDDVLTGLVGLHHNPPAVEG